MGVIGDGFPPVWRLSVCLSVQGALSPGGGCSGRGGGNHSHAPPPGGGPLTSPPPPPPPLGPGHVSPALPSSGASVASRPKLSVAPPALARELQECVAFVSRCSPSTWPVPGPSETSRNIYGTPRAAPARGWRTHLHVDQRGHQGGEFSLHPEPQARAGAGAPRQEHVAEENLPEGGAAGADAAEGPHVDAQAASPCQAGHRGRELGPEARPAARGPPKSHSSECRAHVGVNRPGSAGRLSR